MVRFSTLYLHPGDIQRGRESVEMRAQKDAEKDSMYKKRSSIMTAFKVNFERRSHVLVTRGERKEV